MTDPVTAAARAAAGRLADQYGPGLAVDVEAALSRAGSQRRDQYVDPVAIGELIVSIANLSWTLYLGLKTKTAKPTSEVVARSVRVELRRRGESNPAALDTITDVIVTEIIKAVDD